jgi:F5/8 type C domain-containing protein
VDDDLRLAIDRLVRSGGRLTASGASGASLVLDQPGIRFGILEVRGRLTLPNGEAVGGIGGALPSGWTDPTVTQRLGREIRLHPADAAPGAPLIRSRTWRVPPALASEIVDDVRIALGDVTGLEFDPVATREPRSPVPAISAAPTAGGHPTYEIETVGDDRADPHRAPARMVPAPVRAIAALGLVAVVAFAWAGMIRGAPRVPLSGAAQPPASAIAVALPSVASSRPLDKAPEPPPSTAAPPPALPASFASHLVGASSEGAGPASAAIDGDPVSAWHAAFGVPQWIEIALDKPSTVTEVLALIAQSEPGISRHMIQVAQADGVLHLLGIVDQQTDDHDLIRFNPATPMENVERIRIETLDSPSNAGWYEVVIR